MLFNSPFSVQKADQIISTLNLNPNCNVIDIGCGEGEFLTRLYQTSNANCLGIDIDSTCIELAKKKAQQHAVDEKLRFLFTNIQEYQPGEHQFDLAVCIGSTHAFDQGKAAYPNALKQMSDWVKSNGLILIGEGYWKQNPAQEYLDFLGDPTGIYNSHEENIQQAESLGFIPLYAVTSNQDEWDHFEWCFLMEAERQAIAEPDNAHVQNKLVNVRKWNQYYRKFGRNTMGFGFYLYLKPM